MTEIKKDIQAAIQSFTQGDNTENALALFSTLGYNTSRRNPFHQKSFACFEESFLQGDTRFNQEKAHVDDWQYVDLLFQLSKNELSDVNDLFDTGQVDQTIIETYLFFFVELVDDSYSRTELSQITREINKVFPMPVMVLFKYRECLTLSIINRRLHKLDSNKDVLEKVTLIKDINIHNPHRAHIEILYDLSIQELQRVYKFINFVELQNAWQKTLDTKELNKRFYRELSNWYFWAINNVSFPNDVNDDKDDTIYNSESVIRLLTRLIFIWFIKEKGLIPEKIFSPNEINKILKNFHQPGSNVYYRAILQNLFFATLNQIRDKRAFAEEGGFIQNREHYGVKNVFRYASEFNIPKEEVIQLFDSVPFLNGGLFDCLDNDNIYLDGFSRNPAKQANVPDYLFFSEEQTIDLSDVYADKKKDHEKVKGLFDIFNHYKFTISENTPIEEEVALDPELLGRVFENLLASYNPETKTTARKQTGSFYTPREIVNYMVDESLKAYLKDKLVSKADLKSEDAEAGLELLLGYNEKGNVFNPTETATLIVAIDQCKILDPACGSGAFPMGILHKLVHILDKLDPGNVYWREIQKDRALDETRVAFQIGDKKEREERLKEINEIFENNSDDYGRKLFLIENCIYGVDIQPIAVQISKLRFFISLIVDQIVNRTKDNFGIRALPNLETKFVAADTLIGLEKPESQRNLFENPEVAKAEEELKELRHRYFSANTRREKLAWQKVDQELREKISNLLVHDGWEQESAKQVIAFNPYDQNASSPFFDAEWMFGITEGFNIVIGNPPYIQIQNFSGMQKQKDWEKQQYDTYTKTGDVYCLFYEKGFQLLGKHGKLAYITSNKWMRANYGKKLRKYFSERTNPVKLIDFENYSIFEATVNTNILLLAKETKSSFKAVSVKNNFDLDSSIFEYFNTHYKRMHSLDEDSWIIISNDVKKIRQRIEQVGAPLKDWDISIYRGILTGFNEAFIIDGAKKDELLDEDPKSEKIFEPILLGKDIKRYCVYYQDLWLINTHNGYCDKNGKIVPAINVKENYIAVWKYLQDMNKKFDGKAENRYDQGNHWTNLRNCAYINEFYTAKIAWGNLALKSQFALVQEGMFINAPSPLITPGNKYLLAVLNSKIGDYYIRSLGVTRSGGYFEYKPMFIERLPVPHIPESEQMPFKIFVDYILFTNSNGLESITKTLESVIDGMVYNLYFTEEIETASCNVLIHLNGMPEFDKSYDNEKKMKIVKKVYNDLSDPAHPVSLALEKMKTIPEIRIIEGLDD